MNDYKISSNKLWLILGIVIFALLIGIGLTFTSNQPQKNANLNASAQLGAVETFYDFGTVSMKSGNVSKTFSIRNNSQNPVTVGKIYTSCMCTAATLITQNSRKGPFGMPGHGIVPGVNEILEPDQEAQVEVVFDPAAHGPAGVGPVNREVYLETSDGNKLTLSFKADVTP